MDSSKVTSFIPYLEAKQKEQRQMREAPKPAATSTGGTALSLLTVLANAPAGGMKLAELQPASGMNYLEFSEALKRLSDSGYLTVTGAPGSEVAQLTKVGAEVADLSRPA
jgi:hypothetical protein